MKMFFSRADAVTLQESKCRLCQEASLQNSPGISPTAVPWGQGTPPVPGVEGQQSCSAEPCRRRGASSPFYSPVRQHLIYQFPERTPVLSNAYGAPRSRPGVQNNENLMCGGLEPTCAGLREPAVKYSGMLRGSC